MSQRTTPFLFALSIFAVPLLALASDDRNPPEQTAEPTVEPGSPSGAAPIKASAPVSTDPSTATESAEADDDSTASESESESQPPTETKLRPVTGAFGIPLGEPFGPCMVARIISEEPHTYRKAKDVQASGIRYQVEPKVPNPLFNGYSVLVNESGIVYAIQGEHEPAQKASVCDVTKRLAGALEEIYGKPRGQGALGAWYSFRDPSSAEYRGVRLYAPRCRNGRYSIQYSDDQAKAATPAPSAEPTEASGL